MTKPKTWTEIYLSMIDGKVCYGGVGHAYPYSNGYNPPFNKYNDNMLLVIEGEEKDLWKLLELLDKMKLRLPDEAMWGEPVKSVWSKIKDKLTIVEKSKEAV